MKDHLMNLALFALVLWLTFKIPHYPAVQWKLPCAIFCGAVLLWLTPEVARSLRAIQKRAKEYINKESRGEESGKQQD